MNKIYSKINLRLFMVSFLLVCLTSCKKEIDPALPGDTSAIGVNFFSASDVTASYVGNGELTAIYVDEYHPMRPISVYAGVPAFYSGTGESPQLENSVFSYFRYNTGQHHFMFTDSTNNVVLDTMLNLPANSFNSLYFADAPTTQNAVAAYKTLAVEERNEKIPVGKMGIRFVHLSPDAGNLTVSMQKSDGSQVALLPDPVSFLSATPYQYLDSSAVVSGLVRFTLANSANGASVITGIPFYAGRTYVIVIRGFLNDQRRQIVTGEKPDGSREFTSINIQNNLRASVRRSQ